MPSFMLGGHGVGVGAKALGIKALGGATKGATVLGALGLAQKPEGMDTKESLTTAEGWKERGKAGAISAVTGLALGGLLKGASAGKKALYKKGLKSVTGDQTLKQMMKKQEILERIIKMGDKFNKSADWKKSKFDKLIPHENAPRWFKWMEKLMNPSERYAAYDEINGTKMYEAVIESVQASNHASNWQGKLLTTQVAPFEKRLAASGYTGTQLGQFMKKGKYPTREAAELADDLYAMYDELPMIKGQYGLLPKRGLKKGYPYTSRKLLGPLRETVPEPPSNQTKGKLSKLKKIQDPGYMKPMAKEAKFPEEAYEQDVLEVFKRRIDETARSLVVSPSIKQKVTNGIAVMQMNGDMGRAAEIANWYGEFSGYGKTSEQGIVAFMSDLGKKDATQLFETLKLQNSSVGRRVLKNVNKLMFAHWVGINPLSNIKQSLQHPLLAPVENGTKHTLKAEAINAKILLKSKDPTVQHINKVWTDRVRLVTRPAHGIDPSEMAGGKNITKIEQMIDKYFNTLMTSFTGLDINNVRKGFIGGYTRVMDQGLTPKVLEGLLPSQQAYITRGMTKGIEEAAIRNGIVRTLRINFIYNAIDKPELLRMPGFNLIPFTTWGRNQWMRFVGDIHNKNYKNVAKRIAQPLVLLQMFRAATGYEIPGAHPVSSMASILQPEALPALSGPAAEIAKGRYETGLEDLATTLTPYNFLKRYEKFEKKGALEGGLGLKKSRFIKDMFK